MTEGSVHRFRIYIVNSSPAGKRAVMNFRRITENFYPYPFELEIIDILEQPAMAEADRIIAVPALMRLAPLPIIKIIGDLSNASGLRAFLGI